MDSERSKQLRGTLFWIAPVATTNRPVSLHTTSLLTTGDAAPSSCAGTPEPCILNELSDRQKFYCSDLGFAVE